MNERGREGGMAKKRAEILKCGRQIDGGFGTDREGKLQLYLDRKTQQGRKR